MKDVADDGRDPGQIGGGLISEAAPSAKLASIDAVVTTTRRFIFASSLLSGLLQSK
jgi:hypothetical protein